MELITLNENHQPEKLIENYDSLIWAERFNTMGDFQLITGNIETFMNLLPEGKPVSLRDSNVPMITETHQIIRKKNQPQQLLIKGRAFESVVDRRLTLNSVEPSVPDWNVVVKTPSDVAYYILEKICVEGVADSADIFPPEKLQFITPDDFMTSTGPVRTFAVPKGNLLTTVLQYLQTEAKEDPLTSPVTPPVVQHGIRSVRPNRSGTAISIEIYTGTDRSNQVYFDGRRDLLDDGSYLFSKVGSATTAYIIGLQTAIKMDKNSDDIPTGFDRRVILVDATGSNITDAQTLREFGSTSLAEAHETAIFDGSINQDLSPYVYGVDYGLGDIVKLVGDYGLEEKARVTEYIRSEDATGIKSYPTLVTINE